MSSDLFKQDDFRQQYELAKEQGDKRFGSPCEHKHTKDGYCLNCLRKVIVRTAQTEQPHPDACPCDECEAIRFAYCGYED